MKVKYIDYGTGNRVGNTIYLNRNLTAYPKLHNAVLRHEKKHSGGFKFKDFYIDLKNDDLEEVKTEWLRFLFKHPKAWANFLPVLKLGNRWAIDISLTVLWFLILIMIYLIWYLI